LYLKNIVVQLLRFYIFFLFT